MRKILWESKHLEIDTVSGSFKRKNKEDLSEDEEDLDEMIEKMPTITQTQYGIFKLDDSMHPFKDFKFWMGHTNFKITERIANILDDMEGVESLTIISPYRFLLSIGVCFEFKDVRVDIERKLCGPTTDQLIDDIQNEELKAIVVSLIKDLGKKWAIYIAPNGNIMYVTPEKEDFEEVLSVYRDARKISDGILLESG